VHNRGTCGVARVDELGAKVVQGNHMNSGCPTSPLHRFNFFYTPVTIFSMRSIQHDRSDHGSPLPVILDVSFVMLAMLWTMKL